ncbi:hypothetical protein F442_20767, partial [Phytophthora nicotianae P10297]
MEAKIRTRQLRNEHENGRLGKDARVVTFRLPEESLFELYAAGDGWIDEVHCVYTISACGVPLKSRKSGLRKMGGSERDGERVVPDGKRVIGSIGGIEALYGGQVDCCPVEMLVDTGAVASLVSKDVLARVGRSTVSLRPYSGSLNSASGHKIKALGVLDLPVTLGTVEKTLPFIVTDNLHVDAILGTDSLEAFRAVIDLETRTMLLKDTGEMLAIGEARVEEIYAVG